MNKLRRILAGTEFHILVFALACLVFSWPLVTLADVPGGPHLYIYLYGFWALLVILLCAMGWAGFPEEEPPDDPGKGD
ncbi:hypothetical protein GGQ74_000804 [Desulfobaculum xiamenense]|uniref:DUF3311 domain-containing protein n=1 Tax=Desulfobaculum xiamenense TaxID=995050 RepID=A0A846QPM3_9BACT|nr:hypothetical protein [Desulfobaculum xiamenense]NJB67164.1 hypothetical protein [Desulfobaculum xiamenense]